MTNEKHNFVYLGHGTVAISIGERPDNHQKSLILTPNRPFRPVGSSNEEFVGLDSSQLPQSTVICFSNSSAIKNLINTLRKIEDVMEAEEKVTPIDTSWIKPGEECLFRPSNDDAWYRATIKDFHYTTEGWRVLLTDLPTDFVLSDGARADNLIYSAPYVSVAPDQIQPIPETLAELFLLSVQP
jgi:hypothetical protein